MTLSKGGLLAIDIVFLLVTSSGALLGATILVIIIKFPSLHKNVHLRLVGILLTFDCLSCVTYTPYALTLVVKWVPGDILFNYPPILIILPVAITLSLANVSSVTTLAIAIDRVHSIYWPIDYQHKNKERYATLTGMIGCICAIIELIALCASTPFVEHRGCPTFGCFVNATYLAIYSAFQSVLNICELIITSALLIKLYRMRIESGADGVDIVYNTNQQKHLLKKIRNANRVITYIIVGSVLLVNLPYTFVVIMQFVYPAIYQSIGPVIAVFISLGALYRAIVFSCLNREIRSTFVQIGNRVIPWRNTLTTMESSI